MTEELFGEAQRQTRLTSLMIENFRGVRDQQTFDLDASAVLLWGPNGTGKTTLFDALLWLLQGSVPRLATHTMRRNEEYVSNMYRRGAVSVVSADLRVGGRSLQVTRRGDNRSSTLEITEDGGLSSGSMSQEELQRILVRGQLPLGEVLATSGLLQQDDLRLLLRDKPDQRYRQLLRLLGLEVLEQFERQVRAWQSDARAASKQALDALARQRDKASQLTEQVETIRLLGQRTAAGFLESAALDSAIADAHEVVAIDLTPRSAEELAAFHAEATEVGRRVAGTLAALERVPLAIEEVVIDESAVEAERELAATRLREAQVDVATAQATRETVQQMHDALNALAALAIPLLKGGERDGNHHTACPVCLTRVDAARVVANLESRAQAGASLASAEAALAQARARVSAAGDQVAQIEASRRVAATQRQHFQEAAKAAAAFRSQLSGLAAGERVRLVGVSAPSGDEHPENALRWVVTHRPNVESLLRHASSSLSTVATAARTAAQRAQAAQESAQRTSQLPRVEAQLSAITATVAERQSEYDVARRAETVVGALAESTTSGTAEIFRERFAGLEPLMNDIYGRLDPHPAFTKLDFRVETYRARGTATATVTDEAEGIQANPLLIFSSAQANIVALSAFLALGWAAADSGLPFVLMDDPLQSLDDVNVLGFADLMRQLRRQRQVVLSTHEERFARVLERKLSGRTEGETLIVHRFLSWSRQGPQVETRRLEGITDRHLRVLAS